MSIKDDLTDDWNTAYLPDPEFIVSLGELGVQVCEICHATINEDGTADNCAGECDRGIPPVIDYEPLDFN